MLKNFFGARFIVAAMLTLALTFMAASPIEAAKGVNYYRIQDKRTQGGRVLVVSGYFYNDTNQKKYIESITFKGNTLAFEMKFPVHMYISPKSKINRAYSIPLPKNNLSTIPYSVLTVFR